MEMGFDVEVCKEALGRYDWDINKATNFLLGGWRGVMHENALVLNHICRSKVNNKSPIKRREEREWKDLIHANTQIIIHDRRSAALHSRNLFPANIGKDMSKQITSIACFPVRSPMPTLSSTVSKRGQQQHLVQPNLCLCVVISL